MTNLESSGRAGSFDRWGIVVSAGNGARARDPADPGLFLLEQTLQRAEKLIPAQKLLVVIPRAFLEFDEVRQQMALRPPGCVIVQPENKDIGPGILLPLMYLEKREPAAVVAVLPSDRFVLEEDFFKQHVERAFRIVESDRSRIVFLGAAPTEERDPGWGYILPGAKSSDGDLDGIRTVEMFVEKPSADAATMMMKKGALWNTLVLVATCNTLLQAIERAAPHLYGCFELIQDAIDTPGERKAIEQAYHELVAVDFFNGVLNLLSYENRQNVRVLPVQGVTWATAYHVSALEQRLAAAKAD
jgi:mannose-1-phosphate guanylyltransferase